MSPGFIATEAAKTMGFSKPEDFGEGMLVIESKFATSRLTTEAANAGILEYLHTGGPKVRISCNGSQHPCTMTMRQLGCALQLWLLYSDDPKHREHFMELYTAAHPHKLFSQTFFDIPDYKSTKNGAVTEVLQEPGQMIVVKPVRNASHLRGCFLPDYINALVVP